MSPVLEMRSLSAGYSGKSVVADISLSLAPGEVLGIVGESGSGKSTLLRAVLGAAEVLEGQVRVDGKTVLLPQSPEAAFDPLRPYRAQFRDTLCSHGLWQGKEKAWELFERLGFGDGERVWNARPWELSGGMNQRVALALLVMLQPKVILADEPTSALDADSRERVCGELQKLREWTGAAVLLVTHDLRLAEKLCDRIAVLHRGRVVGSGPAAQVMGNPEHPYTRRLVGETFRPRKRESPPAAAVLEVNSVSKTYRHHLVRALEPVSFSVYPGETLGIVGKSGSGKSTLLRLIAGLEKPDEGSIFIEGRGRMQQKAQLVFQDAAASFDPKRPMGAAILDAMKFLRPALDAQARQAELARLLDRVGLPGEIAGKRPSEASGGQCQRMALARALAAKPRLLLCDEITSALDTLARANLLRLLDKLQKEEGLSMVFVCHDPAVTDAFCDRVVKIDA